MLEHHSVGAEFEREAEVKDVKKVTAVCDFHVVWAYSAAWLVLSVCNTQGLEKKQNVSWAVEKKNAFFKVIIRLDVFWWGIWSAAFYCSPIFWRICNDEHKAKK